MRLPHSIQKVLEDNVSGSVSLLKRLIIALENELLDPQLDPATFISYIEQVRRKLEMFTVIRHFCEELILSHNISVKQYPANYLDFIQEYREFWERAPQQLKNNLVRTVELNHKKVMLHSNSGTVSEVFRLLAGEGMDIRIVQTLSSPAEEGRLQALELAKLGFQVTLIPDVLAAGKMKEMDYLILAADQVRRNTIVNKTGSLQMALAAREFNVPLVILTESRKINKSGMDAPFRDSSRDEKEILKGTAHPNVSALNLYFEEIPGYLVSKIITEKKILDTDD